MSYKKKSIFSHFTTNPEHLALSLPRMGYISYHMLQRPLFSPTESPSFSSQLVGRSRGLTYGDLFSRERDHGPDGKSTWTNKVVTWIAGEAVW